MGGKAQQYPYHYVRLTKSTYLQRLSYTDNCGNLKLSYFEEQGIAKLTAMENITTVSVE